jgi:hypothetical protein
MENFLQEQIARLNLQQPSQQERAGDDLDEGLQDDQEQGEQKEQAAMPQPEGATRGADPLFDGWYDSLKDDTD